jgi:hypothetical protein
MADDIDALLGAEILAPPTGFANRITTLARTLPQCEVESQNLKPWQWASLAAGAGFGTVLLSQFLLFAFVTTGAQ